MKKTVLMTFSYLVELDEEELKIQDNSGVLDKFFDRMDHNYIAKDKSGKRVVAKWKSSRMEVLEPEKGNCGKCSKCNCWVTDLEKPNPILALKRGTRVNNILLCEQCLLTEHPKAF